MKLALINVSWSIFRGRGSDFIEVIVFNPFMKLKLRHYLDFILLLTQFSIVSTISASNKDPSMFQIIAFPFHRFLLVIVAATASTTRKLVNFTTNRSKYANKPHKLAKSSDTSPQQNSSQNLRAKSHFPTEKHCYRPLV